MRAVLPRRGATWTLGSQPRGSSSPTGQEDGQREQLDKMADRYHRSQGSLDVTGTGVNDAVCAYGAPLVDDENRFGDVVALGLDETLFYRKGPYHIQQWSTSIVDVKSATLLDVVCGRGGENPKEWIVNQSEEWRQGVKWGTLDLSGSYRAVFRAALPKTTLVVDPFHLIQLANKRLGETKRRVQQEVVGNRGRAGDPLYRIRRLLGMTKERLTDETNAKLTRFLEVGDPDGEVAVAWRAKESLKGALYLS